MRNGQEVVCTDKKKLGKISSSIVLGNSEGIDCKVIYDEEVSNISANEPVFWIFLFMHVIQHRTSDSTVSEDAGIEPRSVAPLALTARHSNHSARYHPPI
jgi:hypothetical protein